MERFCLEVSGDFACFTRPEMKVERVSYDVMTPSAARSVFEAILWKPAIRWEVKCIEVLKPIRWISVRRNEVKSKASVSNVKEAMNGTRRDLEMFVEDERTQRASLLLRDVAYRIYAELVPVGDDGNARACAFIEMADRRVEWYWLLPIANCVRHTHPGLATLERPQFADFGRSQGEKVRERARWLDEQLAAQPWMAGERFTIADITAFCALEFARGLMKFNAGAEGFAHLQAWRERMAERESARVF